MEHEHILLMGTNKMIPRYAYNKPFKVQRPGMPFRLYIVYVEVNDCRPGRSPAVPILYCEESL
jgi:hypothetical protein